MSSLVACPLCGAVGEPLLCAPCQWLTTRRLEELPYLWAMAAHNTAPGSSTGQPGANKPGSRPPVNLDVVSWCEGSDLIGALSEWEQVVREDRHLARMGLLPPRGSRTHEVKRLVHFLMAHSTWLLFTFNAADEYARNIRDLHWQALDHAGIRAPKSGVTAICPCGATLRFRNQDRVTCTMCGSVWATNALIWQALQDEEMNTPAWAYPADVAWWCQVDVTTVRRWRARNRIDRLGEFVDLRGAHRVKFGADREQA